MLDNITNMTTYIQNLDNYAIVQSVVISKTPITPTSSTSWDFEYIKIILRFYSIQMMFYQHMILLNIYILLFRTKLWKFFK